MRIPKALWHYCKSLFPVILFVASMAQADDSLDNYYVVELIVFTNEAKANLQEETWPNDIELTLPAPDKRAYLAELDIADVYPELAAKIAEALTPTAPEAEIEGNNSPDNPETVLPDVNVSKTDDANGDQPKATTSFYPLLGDNYSQQDKTAEHIRYSSGRHRLLLHKTWLQKFTDEDNAPSIILQAGNEQYGFHEVAGSIKLFKSRFLHLQTNLWRLHFRSADATDTSSDDDGNFRPWPTVPEIEIPEPPSIQAENKQESTSSVTVINETAEQANGLQDDNPMWQTPDNLPPLQPDLTNVALMQQDRRLRSREIHYIDHPLFGLIIEIRPFELPEPVSGEAAP